MTPQAQVGEYVLGNVTYHIYRSLILTTQHALTKTWLELERSYVELTGDNRHDLDDETVKFAVAGAVQEAWYKHFGRPVPKMVHENQLRRLQAAKEKHVSEQNEQPQGEEVGSTGLPKGKKKKEPRVTVRGLIRDGIKAGLTDAGIVEMITGKLPGKTIRKKSIRWNRKDLNTPDPSTPAVVAPAAAAETASATS